MQSKNSAEPFTEKYPRLVAELEEHLVEGERLCAIIRQRFSGVVDGD